MTRSKEGTKTILDTSLAAHVSTSRSGSLTMSSAMMTDLMPLRRGPNISQTESTKLKEVFWQQTSSASNGYASHIQLNRLMGDLCEAITPLGKPVEPDVWRM